MEPWDPNSAKGQQISAELTEMLTESRLTITGSPPGGRDAATAPEDLQP